MHPTRPPLPKEWIQQKQLRSLTTFGIGGPALFYQAAETIEEMRDLLVDCQKRKMPWMILGKGSNVLFDDRGFAGAVLHNKISFFEEKSPGLFLVGAGYSFSYLGIQTARKGWGGLEFASGIPGSVGGAVYMNAGANGKNTAETLEEVLYLLPNGKLEMFRSRDLTFGYRTSPFQGLQGAIVAALFRLSPFSEARSLQKEILSYRISSQPYGEKSAGCFFRNPPHVSAGQIIDQLGWKGKGVGGAQISIKHANFLLNTGHATSTEVEQLASQIQKDVQENFGILLDREVQTYPYQPLWNDA